MTAVSAVFTPPTLALPEYTYKVPESEREWQNDPKSITFRSFTVLTEMDAYNAADMTVGVAYELAQRSVIKLDGQAVDQGLDLMTRCSPKVRQLIVKAINKLFMPSEEGTKAFLESVEVYVP